MDRKLNEDDGYLESVRLWIEAQQFLIDELHIKKDYTIKNIEILKKALQNTEESILHEEEQLLSYKNKNNV
jgi:hypothetical protein